MLLSTAVKEKNLKKGNYRWTDLRKYAVEKGEPKATSGKQEYFENIINRFI